MRMYIDSREGMETHCLSGYPIRPLVLVVIQRRCLPPADVGAPHRTVDDPAMSKSRLLFVMILLYCTRYDVADEGAFQ